MTSYLFIGDHERTFPELSLVVRPGDCVERDENPDSRWFDEVTPGVPGVGQSVAAQVSNPPEDVAAEAPVEQ